MIWSRRQGRRTKITLLQHSNGAPGVGPTFLTKIEDLLPPTRDPNELYGKYNYESPTREELEEIDNHVRDVCGAVARRNGQTMIGRVKEFLFKPVVLRLLQLGKKWSIHIVDCLLKVYYYIVVRV